MNNAPPSALVIIPASGADAGNDNQPILLDAVASPGVTSVSIVTNIDRGPAMITAVPTIYGWIAYTQAVNLCNAGCNTGTLPLAVYAVAAIPMGERNESDRQCDVRGDYSRRRLQLRPA